METELFCEWFEAFASMPTTLHVETLTARIATTSPRPTRRPPGRQQAIAIDDRQNGRVPSTKGQLLTACPLAVIEGSVRCGDRLWVSSRRHEAPDIEACADARSVKEGFSLARFVVPGPG